MQKFNRLQFLLIVVVLFFLFSSARWCPIWFVLKFIPELQLSLNFIKRTCFEQLSRHSTTYCNDTQTLIWRHKVQIAPSCGYSTTVWNEYETNLKKKTLFANIFPRFRNISYHVCYNNMSIRTEIWFYDVQCRKVIFSLQ